LKIPKALHGSLRYTVLIVSMLFSLYGAEPLPVVVSRARTCY